MNQFSTGLDKNKANYKPLNPISFLFKAEEIFPDRLSLIYNDINYTWKQTAIRCRKFASALRNVVVGKPWDAE